MPKKRKPEPEVAVRVTTETTVTLSRRDIERALRAAAIMKLRGVSPTLPSSVCEHRCPHCEAPLGETFVTDLAHDVSNTPVAGEVDGIRFYAAGEYGDEGEWETVEVTFKKDE